MRPARPANIDGAAGALDEVKRIVAQLRSKWPTVRIVLRGDSGVPTDRSSSVVWDSGFCREELMAWCEAEENHVDFLFGLARNSRLQKIIGKQMHEATLLHAETGKGGPRLYRVRLSNAQELGAGAARRRQGRVSRQGRKPALRGNFDNSG